MDKELKEKWIAALRSGNYTQGRYILRDKLRSTHCCLGVLAEQLDNDWGNDNEKGYDLLNQYVPEIESHPFFDMNDSQGKSFSEIADYIEENL